MANVDTENGAGIGRVTCGWPLPGLELAHVRRFWRDVHSPAIARRAGIYEYRHQQFGRVRSDVFPAVDGILYACGEGTQLQWQSDVRYADQAGLDRFGADPAPDVKAHLLGDIDMLVGSSTTYLVLGTNGRTYRDETGDAPPLGVPGLPTYGLFFRMRGQDLAAFRTAMTRMAERWAAQPGVVRLRLSLFEIPDIEAERAAGYPIKTHPHEQQYQAWIDLTVADEAVCRGLLAPGDGARIAAVHAYPVDAAYTFNHAGRPTLAGLRGYCAVEAIGFFDAAQHREPSLLEWMFGPVASEGGKP